MKRLNTQSFLQSYKHGLYLFLSDSCAFCQDYKRDIERIDSPYLYIVEVVTEEEKQAIWDLLDRIGFPLTAGYLDDEIKFLERGQRFGNDFTELVKFLEECFPKTAMTEDELLKRQKAASKTFKLSLYVFPPEFDETSRKAALCASNRYEEIAIDVDEHHGLPSDPETRVRALRKLAQKIVIFNVFETNQYSEVGCRLMQEIGKDMKYDKTSIEHRTLQEAVEASERPAED